MKRLAIFAVALLSCMTTTSSALAIEDQSTPAGENGPIAPSSIAIARYEGRTIDLRDGWGTAAACYVDDHATTTCFRTEDQMDAFIAEAETPRSSFSNWKRLVDCGSTLRLYDAISYGTPVLGISLRFAVINLSTLGFDNRTTSYKVGACTATMWDGASGSGSVYPGNTSAGAQSPNMVTGWNNRIGSVYLW
jgi:hypothetical protein